MARPIRVEFENAVYHVTARGNARGDIGRGTGYGYSDGSGVHRVIQRLEAQAKNDSHLDQRLKSLARHVSRVDPVTWNPSIWKTRVQPKPLKTGITGLR